MRIQIQRMTPPKPYFLDDRIRLLSPLSQASFLMHAPHRLLIRSVNRLRFAPFDSDFSLWFASIERVKCHMTREYWYAYIAWNLAAPSREEILRAPAQILDPHEGIVSNPGRCRVGPFWQHFLVGNHQAHFAALISCHSRSQHQTLNTTLALLFERSRVLCHVFCWEMNFCFAYSFRRVVAL